MTSSPNIRITEVGPRDGLQNEAAVVNVDQKVAFIDLLSESGVAEIEVSSFVSPRWVPQLGDAEEVLSRIRRRPGVVYSALVPNEQGALRALESKVDKIAFFTAASDTFSLKNTNATIEQTLERFVPVIELARSASVAVRAYISCTVACPYEGPTDPARVREVAERLLDLGADEIDLAETLGVAVPSDIEALYDGLAGRLEPAQTTLHLHDTRGTESFAYANVAQKSKARAPNRVTADVSFATEFSHVAIARHTNYHNSLDHRVISSLSS